MIRNSIFFVLVFFFSCFNSNKIDKKSNNNFLAYYNTFYMAEKYFNDALEIIQLNESKDNSIPTQALSLLDDAIKNALIIEEKFYNTKYLDDAYYILGMSSYYKNNITSSEYYFNRILSEYNDGEYFMTSLIMLGNLNLKMNKIKELENIVNQIEKNDNLIQYEKYLYYLLLADYSIYNEDVENEKKYYLLALDNLISNIDKISIYYKLLNVSENQNDYLNSILYIDNIEMLLDETEISEELMTKWIDYNRKINNFNIVLDRLSELIQKEQLPKKLIYHNIEISKTYIDMNEYKNAENILMTLVDDYIDNTLMKNELSEIYFVLGGIYLNYYKDFEKSQEYYQYSNEKSKTNFFGKKSQDIITSITGYNNLVDEIRYIKTASEEGIEVTDSLSQNEFFEIPMKNLLEESNGLDSLIFNAAQILYFDLEMRDSALHKFEDIIYNYPKSNFRYKSLIIADLENPDTIWQRILIDDYSNSSYIENKFTLLDSLRDNAWNKLSVSKEKSIESFMDIYSNHNDEKSLYIMGFIYDDYLKDIDNTLLYYNMYLEKFSDGIYSAKILDRKTELKDMLEYNLKFIDQKLNYRKGKEFFENKFQIDSSIHYLNLASVGIDRDLKSYCNNISESIKLYRENDSLFTMNYSNLDSVKINLANILYKDLSYDSLAVTYYKDIISNSSSTKNINESLAALSNIEQYGNWDSLLYSNIQDSNLYILLINNSKRKYEYHVKGSEEDDILDLNWFEDKYKKHFQNEINNER